MCRHGTISLFAALDVASGFVIGKCHKRHRAAEFLNFLKEIDAQVPEGLDIHIVMDQDAEDQGVACPPAALSCPLHADFGVMGQLGRALACRARQKAAPSRCSYRRPAARSRYPRLHRSAQQKSQVLQMDQICGPNPGFGETLLPQGAANIMWRTLDLHD
jgi:hypothetical protein